MKDRLQAIIQYKTRGSKREFAALCGWTPPYLTKLLRGDSFGLQPVLKVLELLPEINARWFLLGQGEMFEEGQRLHLQRKTFAHIQALLEIEKYIPVMSAMELQVYENAVKDGRTPIFSPDTLAALRKRLNEKAVNLESKFTAAKTKSDELCKRPTAK